MEFLYFKLLSVKWESILKVAHHFVSNPSCVYKLEYYIGNDYNTVQHFVYRYCSQECSASGRMSFVSRYLLLSSYGGQFHQVMLLKRIGRKVFRFFMSSVLLLGYLSLILLFPLVISSFPSTVLLFSYGTLACRLSLPSFPLRFIRVAWLFSVWCLSRRDPWKEELQFLDNS